ncbi:hypothetical protein ABZ016_14060 [Streptomyces sp. NPDC006372]|uniref:hypothetical protein n=1 Tax=Streptomyces sp. NPDC006372 TaxID=3155599 RepID=UPI0033A28818
MAYKMTGEFAGAMVTVIPIVMLLGAVEAKTMTDRVRGDLERTAASLLESARSAQSRQQLGLAAMAEFRRGYLWSTWRASLASFIWLAVGLAHLIAEMRLIHWFATDTQSDDPDLARFVFLVSFSGFAITLLSVMIRLCSSSPSLRASRSELREIMRTKQATKSETSATE